MPGTHQKKKKYNYILCTRYKKLTSNNDISDIEAPCEFVKLRKIQRQGEKKFMTAAMKLKDT